EERWRGIAAELADVARAHYRELVYDDPRFDDYFRAATPIDVIERLHIGSRPCAPAQRRHPRPARDPVGVLVSAEPRPPDRLLLRGPRVTTRRRYPRPRRARGDGERLALLRHHDRRPGDDPGQVRPGDLRTLLAPGR